jgi:DNA mismatch endonuclease (patch repair protein)
MSRIRGKNTKPELMLRRALWGQGLRYRLHRPLPGRPDIVFSQAKLAVFVDGCFWHGCPIHRVRPKANRAFWNNKLRRNRRRDREVQRQLQSAGWEVVRFWEHEIEREMARVIETIVRRTLRKRISGK